MLEDSLIRILLHMDGNPHRTPDFGAVLGRLQLASERLHFAGASSGRSHSAPSAPIDRPAVAATAPQAPLGLVGAAPATPMDRPVTAGEPQAPLGIDGHRRWRLADGDGLWHFGGGPPLIPSVPEEDEDEESPSKRARS